MIELPSELKNHVAQTVTTLAYCWTITRKDGVVFGFTDHDEPISLANTVHEPHSGLNASAAEAELGMAISTMDVEGALRSDNISENDLKNGKFTDASVTTTLVNWSDPEQNSVLRTAKIGKIEIFNGSFKVELQSIAQNLDKPIGRLVRRYCDANLGDERCMKDVSSALYQTSGTVDKRISNTDFISSNIAQFSNQWFEEGAIEWLSGANLGSVSTISSHQGSRLSLLMPLNNPIAVGDQFRITAGCNKSFATCKAKFANHLNFQGFPHLPGNDAVYTYVTQDALFDGAALVP
jgi:uncharacterized phage protein (TIGR02218 family)